MCAFDQSSLPTTLTRNQQIEALLYFHWSLFVIEKLFVYAISQANHSEKLVRADLAITSTARKEHAK